MWPTFAWWYGGVAHGDRASSYSKLVTPKGPFRTKKTMAPESMVFYYRRSWENGLLEKGSFQKSTCSRDSRDFGDSRDFTESPDSVKYRRIWPFSRDSRDSRDFRDSRDSLSEKTFRNDPFFPSCLFWVQKQACLSPRRSVLLRPYQIYSPYRNSLSLSVVLNSKTKGPGEQGAAGRCPKILLLKIGPKLCQNGALSLP